ncbi:putative peptidoglycan-binding domain-containing protein [Campylobacter concisus]|uniref:putative peptidoglycan-binding domain-containing protein n=1 Tax=Campylobacter concisus TaxID=199 RepID=UPI000CD81C66|nr:putative peptidoglycan-binding domain-containing protein [Campylobacter concisus]
MNYTQAFNLLMSLEFSRPENALHKNPTEKGLTFMGIYEVANPKWQGWGQVRAAINAYGDLKKASVALYNDDALVNLVARFYKKTYWDALSLDDVNSQLKANELFCFAVNVGTKSAVRVLQDMLGLQCDGIMGQETLRALNNYNEQAFDVDFDRAEIAYYRNLIRKNPRLGIYERGWENRARKI